jgi:hypothetical protein
MLYHASVCEQAGVACEALFKVEPSRSCRLYLSTLVKIFWLKDSLQMYLCNNPSTRLVEIHAQAASTPYHSLESTTIPVCSRIAHWANNITSDHEVAGCKRQCIEVVASMWEPLPATRDPNDDTVDMDYCVDQLYTQSALMA